MTDTFEALIGKIDKSGDSFHSLLRKADGIFQISVRSRYSKGAHDAFACDHGATPTQAAQNLLKQRSVIHRYESEDPLS